MPRGWDCYSPPDVVKIRNQILRLEPSTENGSLELWQYFTYLYVKCVLNSNKEAADDLLTSFFEAFPEIPADSQHILQELELIWHYSDSRPVNLPWEGADETSKGNNIRSIVEGAKKPELDIENPAFFQLGNWTATDWITDSYTDYSRRLSYKEIDEHYDPHSWRNSDDHWAHAICARLLCQVPEGEVANRAAVEEAFQALEALFTKLPNICPPGLLSPIDRLFPFRIYFLVAMNLGHREAGKIAIATACSKEPWRIVELFGLPALYEPVFDKTVQSKSSITPQGSSEMLRTMSTLGEALDTRKQRGPVDEFAKMSWPELLHRLSLVACKALKEEDTEGKKVLRGLPISSYRLSRPKR